ncbi:MAG: hypothetical protein PUE01_14090, partial [Clostridiaceae bacterium]|nr:hypothetical protein [Clostridiaceae bacterium]
MNKLGVLLRANLINSFGINKIKEGTRNKGKDIFVGISYALSILLIGVLVAIYSVTMAKVLKGLDMMDLLLQSSIFI